MRRQVLDEADRLLQTDSLGEIMKIFKRLPQHGVGDLRLQARDDIFLFPHQHNSPIELLRPRDQKTSLGFYVRFSEGAVDSSLHKIRVQEK